MEITTRQLNANGVAKRWQQQYPGEPKPTPEANCVFDDMDYDDDKRVITYQLLQLGPTPDPDKVDEIIGNDGWTKCSLRCDECLKDVDATIFIGGQRHEDQEGSNLCVDCVRKALDQLQVGSCSPVATSVC